MAQGIASGAEVFTGEIGMAASTSAGACARLRPLAACLALALSAHVFASPDRADRAASARDALDRVPGAGAPRANQTLTVKNCLDDGTDSLRDVVVNHAQSGDTVDLTLLPILCGTAQSTITLSTGELVITQDDLTLQGPAAADGSVTISGGGVSRILKHAGAGTLVVENLALVDGYFRGGQAYGGCIWGTNVYLRHATVSDCIVLSDTGYARGGGIRSNNLKMLFSTVSGNEAIATTKRGFGGGIATDDLQTYQSVISNNEAHDVSGLGWGGGAYASSALIFASTISNNTASVGGGLSIRTDGTIVNSTISGNAAHDHAAALYWLALQSGKSLRVWNSTIAFNHTESSSPTGAVQFMGLSPGDSLQLQSSIIANNTKGVGASPADLFVGQGVLSGTDNLIIATNVSPPFVITVSEDPKLGPLQFNGGWTPTHSLMPGSPAVHAGNNTAIGLVPFEQRGTGYPRTTGPNASTDIGALQFDSIFFDGVDSPVSP